MPRPLIAITGASSGIGETFARKLAPDYDLLLIARREDRLQALAEELTGKTGSAVEILPADLTDPSQLENAALRIAEDPRLVLLVNNAGFGTRGLFWENDYQSQEQMHQLHVMATLRLTHAALGNLVPRDMGAIVNVASVSAFVRIAGTASYAATKGWMNDFTEGIHLDLRAAKSRVIVQALCPGFTYSEFHKSLRGQGGTDPEDRAGGGFWMTSDYVVDASLEGLHRGKLFVVPNWRYRFLTGFLSKLPSALRLAFEDRIGESRRGQAQLQNAARTSLPGKD